MSLNVQQMPKSRAFLSSWKAREGHKLVQLDYTSVEPVVLTAASRDPSLLKIYGPTAKPNDIYLFTGSALGSLGTKIREYYNPNDPKPEDIAAAKKHCKPERNVAKTVHLAAMYNAFPKKIHQTLALAGVEISLAEVTEMHSSYWELYAGVKAFEKELLNEYYSNKGYLINGFGVPIPIAPTRVTYKVTIGGVEHEQSKLIVKDLVNRYVQHTAHMILTMYIARIGQLREERGVEMYPWLVDFHDETIWEVPDDHTQAARKILEDALSWINEYRQSDIPINGGVMLANNLADIKIEDE